jgi:hypothetical protein
MDYCSTEKAAENNNENAFFDLNNKEEEYDKEE